MTAATVPEEVPGPAPGRFEVEYTAEDGTRLRVPLADAVLVRFTEMQPSRRFRARKGQRHLPGRWWSATDDRHVRYESWLERDQAMWLDWDKAVTGIASQPFRLWWAAAAGEGRQPSHVPDYFAERGEGPPLVVDCRPADRRGPRDLAAFDTTRRACTVIAVHGGDLPRSRGARRSRCQPGRRGRPARRRPPRAALRRTPRPP